MVRTARFAFDDPNGPDCQPYNDPFDEGDDPLYEAPMSDGDELPSKRIVRGNDPSHSAREHPELRTDSQPKAA